MPAATAFPMPLGLVVVVAGATLASFFVLNPGIMSFDSLGVWGMSETMRMNDANPPAYTILLRVLRHLWNSPGVMVLFNVTVLGFGTLLLAEIVRRRNPIGGYLVPCIFLLPFVANFLGVLWKDTAMGVCWWTAAAIALFVFDSRANSGALGRGLLMAVSYLLFYFGLLVRHNAVTAAPFLLFAIVSLHCGRQLTRGLSVTLFLACCIVSIVSLLAGNMAIEKTFSVTRSGLFSVIPIYDLAGITKNTGENAFPVSFSEPEVKKISECYRANDWNVYDSECKFVVDAIIKQEFWGSSKLTRWWLSMIVQHPIAYALHRGTVFNSFLRIGYDKPYYILHQGIDENQYGLTHPENGLFRWYKSYILYFENFPFYRPWFWLLLSLAGLGLSFWRSGVVPLAGASIAASGAAYILTYAIAGLASDFRYAYWSVLSVVLITLLLPLLNNQRGISVGQLRHSS